MTRITIEGVGAVSPAGWSAEELMQVVHGQSPCPVGEMKRPGWDAPLPFRRVPAPQPIPTWLRHPRFRRSSSISRFATAAALEALGDTVKAVKTGERRLGIVLCVMAGCVNYSRRFFEEVLRDPSQASPLLFPETVFNAPASHIAALLETRLINYTLIGDDTTFVHGLVTAAGWLIEDRVDDCVVIGAEESDWLCADAMRLFDPDDILAEGAGAVRLSRDGDGPQLTGVSSPRIFKRGIDRAEAIRKTCDEIMSDETGNATLFDSASRTGSVLHGGRDAWEHWIGNRVPVRGWLGNGFNAGTAWQAVAAAQQVQSTPAEAALISVAGTNQEAIALQLAGQGR